MYDKRLRPNCSFFHMRSDNIEPMRNKAKEANLVAKFNSLKN